MRRRSRVLTGVAIAVVVVAGGLVVADVGLRSFAEGQVRRAMLDRLPSNVTGDVTVQIGGWSFLEQYASGTFDEVTLTGAGLAVDGTPLQAKVVANGVSTDQSKPVPRIAATLTLDEAAVNRFLSIPGSNSITLGDGTVGYQGSVSVLGLSFGYDATATATPSGADVLLTPVNAKLSAGSASFDVSGALKAVVAKPISICVAKYLPPRVEITGITPSPGQVTVDATATNLVLSAASLSATGSCG
ncbi:MULTISPECIES: DUF2993 domain-containing protein [Subtercola]|uniref:DUF2993 domain-containing protein n=1 Tax=Subtercola vilae TaxID=2056433 RepID=A0A4V4RFV7_9MICO|nr:MULTISPECIES: DUF2993 domain-containing protein [Subtercola]MEA9985203.1 DUF2993 domain-containing protein [Subtercola sp. RTI3]TIH34544.1 DUF2993 domain-containing protein [Subtercola vilae]